MSKTLEEIKDECSKDFGFKNYEDVEDWNSECMIIDEVAQRYAQSQTQELQEQNAELVEMLKRIVEKQFYSKYSLQSLNSTISESKELLTKYKKL